MEKKNLVPVTEEEKKLSYYKYFEQEMAPVAPEHIGMMLRGPISPDKALKFSERNRLFEPGYHEVETGWCVMPDGTGYIANLTKMPGVTTDMFDWYFAWHGLNNLRYKMVFSAEMHFRAASMRKESRGWFLREDFPRMDNENWLKWIVVENDNGEMKFSTEDVPIDDYPVKLPPMIF